MLRRWTSRTPFTILPGAHIRKSSCDVTRAHAHHEPPMCLRAAAPLLPGPTAAHSAQYLPRRAALHVFSAYLLELCYHLRSSPVLCRRVPCLPCGRGEGR